MKALLKYHRQSPRKVRIVADLIRGKSVLEAKEVLSYTPKKATASLEQLLDSAISNAKENSDKNEKDLYIKKITVNKGFTMKRFIPKWRGTADPIRKFTSNIAIELGEKKGDEKTKGEKTTANTKEKLSKK